MFRMLFWLVVYAVTLCTVSINIKYKDGLEINLKGWPDLLRKEKTTSNTKVVCLCGSTKFKQEFIDANRDETLKGHIVLSVGLFGHIEGLDMKSECKVELDQLHFRKIDLCDEILVLNINKYIGRSTRKEIDYATTSGKKVRYKEDVSIKTGTIGW